MNLVLVTVINDDLAGLRRTEQSVRSQSVKVNWTIVTPNNGSEVFEYSQRLLRLGMINSLIMDSGKGIYEAMNLSIQELEDTDWVWFLNAGDEIADLNSVESVATYMAATKQSWLYGGVYLSTQRGKVFAELKAPVNLKIQHQLFSKNYICHQSTIFKVGFLRYLGGFDLQFRIASDWDLIARSLKLDAGERLPITISKFYLGGFSSIARQKGNKELYKLRKIYLGSKYFVPSFTWFAYRYFRNLIVLLLENHRIDLLDSLRLTKFKLRNLSNND